jgi:hypothetical protein
MLAGVGVGGGHNGPHPLGAHDSLPRPPPIPTRRHLHLLAIAAVAAATLSPGLS